MKSLQKRSQGSGTSYDISIGALQQVTLNLNPTLEALSSSFKARCGAMIE